MIQKKFRGKRIDNGEWVYGSLVVQEKTRIFSWGLSGWESNEIHPESVGQFINKKDKNDIEIYEGDIMKFTHTRCKKLEDCFNNEVIKDITDLPIQLYVDGGEIEVYGNITDNPELLEKQNENIKKNHMG